jgi:molybdate transport system substrate-binding protein
VLLASCSKTADAPRDAPRAEPSPTPGAGESAPRTLIVSVAASTTEAMEALCEQFAHQSGVEVKVNPGPSNGLATQILAGAPADVFLSASREWADQVDGAGRAKDRVDLLTNRLVAVVPSGNPANVAAPEDLATDAVQKIALAGENAPAGTYADQALTKLGLLQGLVDAGKIVRGQDVRSALGYVERGEAEACIVYATDVRVAPGVEEAFAFDPELHDEIVYVLVLVEDNPAARELFEFLQSEPAEQTFEELGFVPLPAAASSR